MAQAFSLISSLPRLSLGGNFSSFGRQELPRFLILFGPKIGNVQNTSYPAFLENGAQSHALPNMIQIYFSQEMNQAGISTIQLDDPVSKRNLLRVVSGCFLDDRKINEGPQRLYLHPLRGWNKTSGTEFSGGNEDPGAVGTAPPEDFAMIPEFDEKPAGDGAGRVVERNHDPAGDE
jgi:hypothetical protein